MQQGSSVHGSIQTRACTRRFFSGSYETKDGNVQRNNMLQAMHAVFCPQPIKDIRDVEQGSLHGSILPRICAKLF